MAALHSRNFMVIVLGIGASFIPGINGAFGGLPPSIVHVSRQEAAEVFSAGLLKTLNPEGISLAEDDEEDSEYSSFVVTSTDLHKSEKGPRRSGMAARRSASITEGALGGYVASADLEPQEDTFEARFAAGVEQSKFVVDSEECREAPWSWQRDPLTAGAGVPVMMQRAEELLMASQEVPNAARRREKTAEQALRLYYHAKWLAEQNYALAAEPRFREAARLAKAARRSVLAAHSLSRLGYFLVSWKRLDEAREALLESERYSKSSNPLAPYLLGVMERNEAGADVEKLRAAEDRILNAAEQPSEDLEFERKELVQAIGYWRAAEESPSLCLDTNNVAHVTICLFTHAVFALRQAAER